MPRSGAVRGGRMGAFWQAVTVWQALAGAWGGCGPDFGGAFGASGGGRGAASGRKGRARGLARGSGHAAGVAVPAGGACLRLPPMICGPSIGGGAAYPRRAQDLAAGMIPCGGACLRGPAPDDLRALSIGGGADDSRRGHASLAVGMLSCGACLLARLLPMTCGGVSAAGRLTHGARAGSHGGMIPCGAVLACACSR